MTKQFEILKKTRQSLISLVSDLSTEQLNEIPAGYNNNIIWNLAHLVATQQGICYGKDRSLLFNNEQGYRSGTKPEAPVSAGEIEQIKGLLLSSVGQVEIDYEKQQFRNNQPWTTRSGIVLSNIDDSINFILYHEGLHMGYIMAMKRLVKK